MRRNSLDSRLSKSVLLHLLSEKEVLKTSLQDIVSNLYSLNGLLEELKKDGLINIKTMKYGKNIQKISLTPKGIAVAKQLYSTGELEIPRNLMDRSKDSKVRFFLEEKGFPMSTVSFYIMRDFLYEFYLLNFIDYHSGLKIFPLYNVESENCKDAGYKYELFTPESKICCLKYIALPDFREKLIKTYLKLTNGAININISLLRLRELFSYTYRVTEFEFELELKELIKEESLTIRLSSGILGAGIAQVSELKGHTNMVNAYGQPYNIIRINTGETN